MRAPTLPIPTELQPPPPPGRAGDGSSRRPAPVGAILAALARITSHAGDPSSMTITTPGHAVAVSLDHREQYRAWHDMLAVAGVVHGDADFFGAGTESQAVLHGWALTVRLVSGS